MIEKDTEGARTELEEDRRASHLAPVDGRYTGERYAFELTAPYRYEAEIDGPKLHLFVPEIAYGVFPNAEFGVEARDDRKREVIYGQLNRLQGTTSNVMSWNEWRNMAETMGGVAVMGGPATGLVSRVHAPITPAPVMAGMQHGAMKDETGAMRHSRRTAERRTRRQNLERVRAMFTLILPCAIADIARCGHLLRRIPFRTVT